MNHLDDLIRNSMDTGPIGAAELLSRPEQLTGHRVYLADDEQGPAAICNVELSGRSTLLLWWLIVGRPLQQQGVGTELLERAIADAPEVTLVLLESDISTAEEQLVRARKSTWARFGGNTLDITWATQNPPETYTILTIEPYGKVPDSQLRPALHDLARFALRSLPDLEHAAHERIERSTLERRPLTPHAARSPD